MAENRRFMNFFNRGGIIFFKKKCILAIDKVLAHILGFPPSNNPSSQHNSQSHLEDIEDAVRAYSNKKFGCNMGIDEILARGDVLISAE